VNEERLFWMFVSPCIDYIICQLFVVRDRRVIQMVEKFDLMHPVAYFPFTKEKLGFPVGVKLINTKTKDVCTHLCVSKGLCSYIYIYIYKGFRSMSSSSGL
jgi:hypothetical protein